MFKLFREWQQRRREDKALVKITATMQNEWEMIFTDLERQLHARLAEMTPEERENTLARLRGEA